MQIICIELKNNVKFYPNFIDLQKQIASIDVAAMQKEIDDLDSIVSDQQVMSSKQQASIAGKALKQMFIFKE
jgi:hypothetical protein